MKLSTKSIISVILSFSLMLVAAVPILADSEEKWYEKQYLYPNKIVGFKLGPDDTGMPEFNDDFIFNNMHHLVYFTVDSRNTEFSTYSGCLYNKKQTMLICVPQGIRKISVPSTCVSISPQALYGAHPSVKKFVKAIITENNGGKWPGYSRYVNNQEYK